MKNPPAFPLLIHESGERNDGMTLRDYFAAKAMAGWIATYPDDARPDSVDERAVAVLAYKIADAMLEARDE